MAEIETGLPDFDFEELDHHIAEFKAVVRRCRAFNAVCWLQETYVWSNLQPRCRSLAELAASVGRTVVLNEPPIPYDGSIPNAVVARLPENDGTEADLAEIGRGR